MGFVSGVRFFPNPTGHAPTLHTAAAKPQVVPRTPESPETPASSTLHAAAARPQVVPRIPESPQTPASSRLAPSWIWAECPGLLPKESRLVGLGGAPQAPKRG